MYNGAMYELLEKMNCWTNSIGSMLFILDNYTF